MGAAVSDDGIIIGANIDVSRIQQAANKMKSLMDDFANSTAKSVQKADQELEKAVSYTHLANLRGWTRNR